MKDLKTEDTKTQKATATDARGQKNYNSNEVIQAWNNANTPALKGNIALSLIELENTFGTQALIDAIQAADRANKNLVLSFNFVKKVLENRQKGAPIDEKSRHLDARKPVAEEWESERPAWLC